ncbi:MAG: Ig-like domain-containing protein [Ferruginibacter sp.]
MEIFTNTLTLIRHFQICKSIRALVLICCIFYASSGLGQAASGAWPLTTDAIAVNSGNVTGSNQTSNGVGTNSYTADGVSAADWATAASMDASKYYEFSITPSAGYNLLIDAVNISHNTDGISGTALVEYSYSPSFSSPVAIGSSFAVSTGASTNTAFTSLSIPVNNSQTLYIRVFAWEIENNTKVFNVKDLAVSGTTVSCAPDVTNFSLPALSAICVGSGTTATVNSSSMADDNYTVTYDLSGANTATGLTVSMSFTAGSGTFNIPAGSLVNSGNTTITITTVTNTATCSSNPSSGNTASLLINANSTINLSSVAGTDVQAVCINTAITDITYATGGGATGAFLSAGSLPTGVTGNFNSGVFTISGTPTASGTFNYEITTTGPCTNNTITGSITVTANNIADAPSSTPTLCINTVLTNITHSTTGATGIGTPTNLPAGVTAAWAGNTITISGTPTASGTFNYSIPLTGGCGTVNATGVITVTADNTAGAASSTPTLCINTTLTNITHSTTGATGIGTPTNLPAGVTAAWAGNTITISGTPTASGTFNYSIPLTGGCGTVNATGAITVTADNTAGAASSTPTLCINTTLTNITHSTTGATGIGTPTNLPAGVNAAWAGNTITISGTPTASGTFNYSIPLTGGCGTVNTTGTITVTAANTAGAASSTPTLCINTALTNITHSTTGATAIGTPTNLPAGVTAAWAGNTITISGTPTVSGTFNYSIPLTGGCGSVNATGTIIVTPANTPGTASSNPTLCINTALTNITRTTTGATGIGTPTNLPAGVTAAWASNIITISGTPTASGTFNYLIPLTGGCGSVNATGTIIVTPANTPGTASSNPTLCINTALTNITRTTTGATGIGTPTNLPAGVTAAWASNTITISGTPTASGTFNYSIPLTGGCGSVNATGTIIVTPANTPGTASSNPTLCINTALTNITRTTTGATGIGTPTNLPAGVTAAWASNIITISGTPTASGTFNYSIPLTGGCGSVNATGTIIVTPANTPGTASSNPTLCINTALTNITRTTTGATGIGTPTNLPAGVTAAWASNIITISGTPTASGTFNYSIPLTGGCGSVNATGTIIVTPANTPGTASSNPTLCINTALTNITRTTTGATGIGTPTNLPAGVTAAWASNTITISGTPTASGTFNYSIPLTGGCGSVNATGTIIVTPANTPGTASSNPTLCINTALTNITRTTTGATGIGTPTNLPAGVTAAWASNTITISGTPTASGTFNYSIPLTGGCGSVNATGTIIVTPNNTITLSSAAGTNAQTICTGSSITSITYNTTGATGATFSGLPAGVSGNWASNIVTISGTPSATGTFNYTINLTGGCGSINANGSITINTFPAATGVTICQGSSGTLTSSAACAADVPGSAGPNFAGTGANGGGPDANWSNATRVSANDDSYTTVSGTGNSFSDPLEASSFGFLIPANATITGIQVSIGRYRSGTGGSGEIRDNSVRLFKTVGNVIGNDNAATGTNWPTTEAAATYGSSSDMWGSGWTPAEINAAGFGVSLVVSNTSNSNSRTANVDYIQITVSYTIPGSLNWYTASSGGTAIGNGTPFNPVGVAGSGLANTNTAGTTPFYAECAAAAGCRTAANFVITPTTTTSNAGPDQSNCNSGNFTLAANTPVNGTGSWSVVTGTATITTPSSPTSTVTGLAAGASVTLRWTITNAPCANSTDDVILTNRAIPTTSNAGPDQNKCNNGSFTLAGNTAVNGAGTWTVVSGTATIATPSSPTSNVTGVPAGASATLRWTIANAPCTASFDDVILTNTANTTTANAGADLSNCNNGSFTLAGNTPGGAGAGTWSLIGGTATITTPSSPTSGVTGIPAGTSATLRWTISNPPCANSTDDVVLLNSALPTVSDAGPDQTICSSVASVTLAGNNPTAGSGNWSVVSGPNTSSAQFGNTAVRNTTFTPAGGTGTYVLRWTISNAPCTPTTDDVNIIVNPLPTITGTLTVCAAGSTTTLTGSPTAAAVNPWVSATTSVATVNSSGVVTGVAAGTSVITYTNNNNCSNTVTVTVTPLPNVTLTASASSVCIGGNRTLTATNSGGTNSQTYSGTSGNINMAIADNSRAAYTYPTITLSGSGGATLTAADVIQVTMNISHNFDDDLDIFLVDPSGTRALLLSSDNGGSGDDYTNTILRTDAANVIGSAGNNNAPFNGTFRPEGTFTTAPDRSDAASNGTGNYNLVIPANALNFSGGAPIDGAWSLRVFDDDNGTSGTLVNWSLSIIKNIGTGNYTSVFSGPATISSVSYSGANNSTATVTVTPPLGSNAYTVTTTDASGCSRTSTPVTVTVNPLPVANPITGPSAVCVSSTITLTPNASGAGSLSYTWSSSNTAVATVSNAGVVTGVAAGTVNITYTVTDGNTCSSTSATYPVTVNARPVVSFTATPTNPICASTNATYTTQAGQSNYIWSVPGTAGTDYNIISGGIGSGSNTVTLQWLTTGSKTVTVNYTNGNGCTGAAAASNTTTVNARPTPTFTAQPGANVCASAGVNTYNITYTTQAGQSSYVWTIPGTAGTDYSIVGGSTSSNTVTVQWLTTGSKTVTVNYTNGSGCTALTAASNTTNVNALPVVNTSAAAVCVNSTITASPNTGGTWASSNSSIATIDNAGLITGVAAGTVTFTYTSTATGCSRTTANVTVNALPVIAPITDGSSAICVNDVTQFTNATTGGTWSITNGTGTASVDASGLVTGLAAGNVTVVYTYSDGNSCTNSVSVPLTINILPSVSPIGGGATSVCVNAQTPAFTNATAGGTWSIINGTGSASITSGGVVTGISAGDVTVVYTVGNGTCTNEDAIPLTINPLPVVAPIAGGTTAVCVNAQTPAFTNATAGGSWSIINGTGTASITSGGVVTGLSAGDVTVVYTYNNGICTNTSTQLLTVNPLPVIAPIGGGAATVCINAATPAFTDATAGGTWSIINGTGAASITSGGVVTGITAGTVTVVYTVGSGSCFDNVTKPLTVNALPVANAITGTNTVCAGSTITLTPNATGAGTLTYTWQSANTPVATVNNAGVVTGITAGTAGITYTATDANGCSSTSPLFTVTVNARPQAVITSSNTTICGGNTTAITGNVTATGAWTLTLSNGAITNGTGNGTFNINVNPASNTTYTITSLTDMNCTATAPDLTGSTIVTVNTPVSINTQPAITQTACSGGSVSFTVAATGSGLTYQWRKGTTPISNGGNISGATSATLTINPLAVGDAAADYNVVISGAAPCTAATSNDAALIVNQAVAITTSPAGQTICSGNDVSFTVAATGSGLTYQWRKNGVPISDGGNISGTNTDILSITGAATTDAGNYSVVVNGLTPCVPVISANATLVVRQEVEITSQPADAAVCATFPATFTVTATGSGLTYQWYKGTFPGTPVTNNANISGATTASLHFNQANIPNIDDYYVVVSGLSPCGPVQSDYAHLNVDRNITIITQPVSQTVCIGSDATFSVVADASGDPLVYQWRKNGVDISGAENDSYTITGTTAGDAGNYDVVITGLAGCITAFSSVETLTLDATSVGGTVNSSAAVCNAVNSGTLNLTGKTGNVTNWEFSTDGGSNWTTIANTTTSQNYNNIAVETQYRAVVQNGVCPADNSVPATISIKPTPDAVATPSSQTICSGDAITTMVLTGTIPSTTFNWTRNNTGTVTGTAASGSGDISGSLTNTTAAPVTVTFTITPTAGGCFGPAITATVVVNPSPAATATPSSQTICSGDAIATIVLSSSTSGATYTWTRNNLINVTGIAASGSGDISGSLVNTTNIPRTVTFTITPSANGCDGTPITATVIVNPTPGAIATPAAQTACSGTPITDIVLSGNVPSTTYSWTRNNTATITGIAASGNGDISGTLNNVSASPVTVTFTITPTANGCDGTPITATVTVEPAVTAVATPSSQSICSGSAITTIALTGATSYTWTRNSLATVTGIAASGSGDISGSLTNTTNIPRTVTFTITPFIGGCPGTPITATVTVNPTPDAIATPSSQTACSGVAITTIALSGNVASTTFNWTRNNTGTVTGIANSGSGDISGTLVNTTASPVTVTFTITPTANGCDGTPTTATVLVNPAVDAIATPSSQSICSGNSITTIALSSSFGSTTYDWTRNNTASATGIAASGSGNISGSLTNTTTSPVTVTFTITPVSAAGCPGIPTTATVTVNPGPDVTAGPLTQSVCSGSPITTITMSSSTPSASLNWVRNNTGSVTGIAANGSGDISGTLTNTTNAAVTVSFTITPSVSGCTGAAVVANVTVRPLPTVNATNTSQTFCSGSNITNIVVTNPNGVASTTLTWTRDNGPLAPGNITGIPASGTGNITGTLTNIAATPQTTNFTITAAASGCSSSTTAAITVNPRPVMTSPATATVCHRGTVNIPLTSTVTADYTWVAANNANTTGESITTQTTSTINNTLVNTSAVPGAGPAGVALTPRQNVVYTVTPTAIAGLGGCAGAQQTVTVTVNPPYNISFYEYPNDDNHFTICDGNLVGGGGQNDMDLISGQYSGATLLWQYSIGSDAGPWTANPGPHLNGLIHDTLPDPPSIFSSMGEYYFRLLVDGCPSDTINMTKTSTITVNAGTPNITNCQVGSPAPITLSGANVNGTASTTVGGYWSITSLSPSNGGVNGTLSNTAFITSASGNIGNVTYTPPTNYAGVVTLTLTSNDPDGNGPCVPLTQTRTITITQAPIISNPLAMNICSGSNTNITLTSVIPSTYAWTIGTITGGITGASAGSGNTINQVLTNPGTTAGTVQYVVTPTPVSPAACAAVTSTITVTVNALPSVSLSRTPATVCQGSTSTLTATNSGGTLTRTYSGYSGSLNMLIADDSRAAYAYPTITLSGSGGATLANTDIIQVKFSINHPYDRDLDIFLVDPSGTRALLLSTDNGGGNGTINSTNNTNYTNTILRTDAANVIGSTTANNTAPFTGTYRPEETPATAPDRSGASTGTYNAVIPANSLLSSGGAPIDGAWSLRVFDDNANDYGTLIDWSLDITKTAGNYTTVFNGPATINAVSYSGTSNTTATATVLPPAGVNSYTATTTDLAGCSRTSTAVDVTVNPEPTLTGATQATVCSGSSSTITLTGLIANSTSTVTYRINAGAPQNITGVTANAAGTATFNLTLTSANNGQTLQITGLTTTSATPNCSKSFTQNVTLVVNPLPTLTGASQAGSVCPGSSAQINLTGLVPNSTATISYSIAGAAQTPVTGITATAGGTGSFNTVALTAGNNGQQLQVTGITITSASPSCPQTFTQNVTLSVNSIPTLSSTLTPSAICSGTTFSYTPSSATAGSSFSWSRAAIAGISQAASSGNGNVSEVLTNTTAAPINVTYVYVTTATGCSNAGQNVVVTVNPTPTVTGATLSAVACAGSAGTINLTGLLPSTTSTINYSINGVLQTAITGVTSTAGGTASFSTRTLTLADNGQILRITSIVTTSSTPSCARTISGVLTVLNINSVPTLSAASQAAAVCISGPATINLTGLVANSTNNTINYTINGAAQTPITGVNANASGNASFNTISLTTANNGQTLTITGITNGTCSQAFSSNVTLAVGAAYVWLGVNTNWFDPANWCGGVPTLASDVLIPGSLANYPLLNTGTGMTRNITIQNTASVTVSGAIMQIAGSITNTGTFNAVNGTIDLRGSGTPQTISGSTFVNRTLTSLIVSNPAGVNVSGTANDTLNITDSLAFGNVSSTTLNTGDNITLISRANRTARVADITNGGINSGNAISGRVIVERFIPEKRSWRLMTVPIQSAAAPTFNAAWQENAVNPDFVYANRIDPHPGYGMLITGANSTAFGFDPSPMMNPSVQHYNTVTNKWVGIPNTNSVKVTDSAGYMVFVRGDRATQIYLNTLAPTSNTVLRAGGQLKTGLQTATVAAGLGSYVVVGNPYASSIDMRKMTTTGAISSNSFVAWDPSLTGSQGVGAYQYFTQVGGPGSDFVVFPGSNGPGGGSYGPAFSVNNTVQSSQAFLVQNAGAGTVSFNENAKVTTSTSTVFKPGKPHERPNYPAIGLLSTLLSYENNDSTHSTTLVDGGLCLYNDNFADDVDLDDIKKLSNLSSENFGIDGKGGWLQIERRKMIRETDTVLYRVRNYRLRSYQLAITGKNINTPGLTGYLEDRYLNTSTPINLDGTVIYKFKVTSDSGAWHQSRFRIVFKQARALPVTFTNVKGYRENSNINVEWNVENESAIRNYDVQKSVDGIHFLKAGTVSNVSNNNASAAYKWIDKNPQPGYNYYRIQSNGIDGKNEFTSVVKVSFDNPRAYITVYPNPLTDGNINVYFINQQAGKYMLRLLNNAGQLIAVKEVKHMGGSLTERFAPRYAIPQGSYRLEITKPGGEKEMIYLVY